MIEKNESVRKRIWKNRVREKERESQKCKRETETERYSERKYWKEREEKVFGLVCKWQRKKRRRGEREWERVKGVKLRWGICEKEIDRKCVFVLLCVCIR